MTLMQSIDHGSVTSPKGFRAAGVQAGIKKSGKADVALVVSDTLARCAASFTANAFAAPPVLYSKEIVAKRPQARAVIINAGNANACTGRQGYQDARQMGLHTAHVLDIEAEDVLVCSTGRIGVPMPMPKVIAGIDKVIAALTPTGGLDAADAIMTTDTFRKSLAVTIDIGGVTVTIGGMAKGAGMIAPAMVPVVPHATMIAVLTTDAAIEGNFLDVCLSESLDQSFNRVTVDGDTSTNDTFIALANGEAKNLAIRPGTIEAERFQQAFTHVAAELARGMVMDGEGATRFVTLQVSGAKTRAEARTCAMAIANSLLCKTAWFGADPNWGRILDAAGYSGVAIKPEAVSLDYDGLPIVRGGMDAGTPEAEQTKAINKRAFKIDLHLGAGDAEFTAWTCDLTYEYVKINADYHT